MRVNLNEINFIKSDGNLLFIHTKTKTLSTRMTIPEILAILPKESMMRIHKSYVINLREVEKLEKHQVTIDHQTIPVANSHRESLENRLLKKS
ncbi:LytTR family DNA-binding domain-containing protein [Algoriphagus boritolerans]|uniref:LytR/AlgR family response regulator transcription factor n=1 Tax=Algoriphagus boritolerans TaxID=308111 RepID=UPI000B1263D3